MPLSSGDIPQGLSSGLKTLFFGAMNGTTGLQWQEIATEVPSTKDTESYGWLGNIPKMREMVGERLLRSMNESSYSLKNKTWESSIEVSRTAIEDEQYGQIRLQVQQMGQEAARHRDELVFSALLNGNGTTAYGAGFDSVAFFATTHTMAGTTTANLGTSALTAEALENSIIAMTKFTDDDGRYLGFAPDTLVVPPDLQFTAKQLLVSTYLPDDMVGISNMAGNPLQGTLRLVVSPYLTDTDAWYLLHTGGIIKPFILQTRTAPEFGSLEESSDSGFIRDAWMYGVRARYAVGYGLWQMGYANVPA